MPVMEETPGRSRRLFTEEFKRDAGALVLDEDRRIIDIARSLGVGVGVSSAQPPSATEFPCFEGATTLSLVESRTLAGSSKVLLRYSTVN